MAEPTADGRAIAAPLAAAAGALFPYLARYRVKLVPRWSLLLVAAATTLALPLAVRRMIDHGFTPSDRPSSPTTSPC